jgi:hypothetical protein
MKCEIGCEVCRTPKSTLVYCEECKYCWGNHHGVPMCDCDEFKYLTKEEPPDPCYRSDPYMACPPCREINHDNNCKGFKHKSLIKRWLGR